MEKTGLKTFVCSFVLSLFTIVTVNKEFFHTPNTSEPEIKIPNKNISLFFKDLPAPASAKTVPVKKIALTLPASAPLELTDELSDNGTIPLTFAAQDTSEPQVTAAAGKPVSPAAVIYSAESPSPPEPQKIDIPLQKPEIVVEKPAETAAFIQTAQKPEPTEEEFQRKTIDDSIPKVIQATVAVKKIDNRKKKAARKKSKAVETALKAEPSPIAAAETNSPARTPQEITLANNEPADLLIPLQKDQNTATPSGKVNIIKAPEENQLAMANSKETIKGMISKTADQSNKSKEKNTAWETMAAKNNEPSTWVVAKGANKHPKNNRITKEKFYNDAEPAIKKVLSEENTLADKGSEEVQLAASKMVDNLLIPIPEEILNDENLTPQLVSSSEDKPIEDKVTQEENEKQEGAEKSSSTNEKKGGLLTSIKSIFSGNESKSGSTESIQEEDNDEPGFFDQIAGKVRKSSAGNKILPTEIRLSFQPNRAEISGPTLRWIQAFANKTIEDSNVGLEIRIDGTSSFELQQKRLNLLQNILTNSGVDSRKINTVFTSREPNSFIIRTIRINNNGNGSIKKNEQWQNSYYQQW